MNRTYSLSQYQLIVSIPNSMKKYLSSETISDGLTFGGSGSYLESISVMLNSSTWSTMGSPTGSWVHTMNANRTGTISMNINQISKNINTLIKLVNIYYQKPENRSSYNQVESFPTITLINLSNGEVILQANDCFLKKIPDKDYGGTPGNQKWEFSCGEIIIQGN